jgi:hypothetical protein
MTTGASAQYVLSANGNISNFGSAGQPYDSAGAGGELTFSNGTPRGNYGAVCRPPLEQLTGKAKNQFTIGYDPNILSDEASYGFPKGAMVTMLAPGGGTAELNGGTVTGDWTLHINGNVYIDGNVVMAAASFANLTSFGLITTGNIYVDPSVTLMDGFYYSSQGMSTCSDGSGNVPGGLAGCNQPLVVNGMLMANNFVFSRTYYGGSGPNVTAPAETVNYLGQMLAEPPPGFSNVLGFTAMNAQFFGERPPLY